jgi:hypothetical protein
LVKVYVAERGPTPFGVNVKVTVHGVFGRITGGPLGAAHVRLAKLGAIWLVSPVAAKFVMWTVSGPVFVNVIVRVFDWPVKTFPKTIGLGESERCPFTPVPLRDTVFVPEPASLEIVSVPVRAPDADGANRTVIVQLPPPAATVEQVELSTEKSPLAETALTCSGAVPVFETVTDFVEEVPRPCPSKDSDPGTLTAGTGGVPVPLSGIESGEPSAFDGTSIEPVRAPAAVGVNVTETRHCAPWPTVCSEQLSALSWKSPVVVSCPI